MISIGENKASLCKGDFHPAALYKGDKKIAGYTTTEFSGKGEVTLEHCYNDKLHDLQIYGNSVQNGTPTTENPIEVQSEGELVTEGEYAGKYKIPFRARGKNLFNPNLRKNVWSEGLNLKYLPDEDCFVINGTVTEGYTDGIDLGRHHANLGIKVKSGKYYKNSVVFLGGSTSKVVNLYSFFGTNSTGEGISPTNWEDVKFSSNVAEGYAKSVTSLPNGAYISSYWLYLHNIPGVTFNNFKFRVMLTETNATSETTSNAPIDYEPYIEPQTFNIYLDEPLRKVRGYSDYIDFENKEDVRKINEVYKLSGDYGQYGDIACIDALSSSIGVGSGTYGETENHVICSHLKQGKILFTNTSGKTLGFYLSECGIDYTSDTAMDEFKFLVAQWNKSGQLQILYALKTPKRKAIELPELPTFKGTTIYEIDTDITATISGKYKRTEE